MLTKLHLAASIRSAVTVIVISVLRVAAAENAEPPKTPLAPQATNPAPEATKPPAEPPRGNGADLRSLIGVSAGGFKRVEAPKLPAMTLRGFIQPAGQPAIALLELAELNRTFVVQVGTEIPIMVAGKLATAGRGELTGLGGATKTEAPAFDPSGQTQVILKVLKVSSEGVTVEAGLLAQTIVIR